MKMSLKIFQLVFVLIFSVTIVCSLDIDAEAAKLEARCTNLTVNCYVCDSKYDEGCLTLDNATLANQYVRPCDGCCVKRDHAGKWILRACTNTFGYSYRRIENCAPNTSKKLCFCKRDLCNAGESTNANSFLVISLAAAFVLHLCSNKLHYCS